MKRAIVFCSVLFFSPFGLTQNELGLPRLQIPRDNPQSPEKVVLGKMLFNDTRLSADKTISCASCHQEDKAFTDGLPVAKGIYQLEGTRNTPTIVNSAFYTRLFFDGRRLTLEAQVLDPFMSPIEHGLKDHRPILKLVREDVFYGDKFSDAFNVDATEITMSHVAKAIASYERTLIAGNSPFDKYFFGGERNALSEAEIRGLNLFRRKGNCANCHEISWNNALFTDNRFYNIGVGFARLNSVLEKFMQSLQSTQNKLRPDQMLMLTNVQRSELGRYKVTQISSDIGKFRTPTLRNISLTAPYMHDGSMKTLEEVVEYYNGGGDKNRFLDPAIFPLQLTEKEKSDIVAFLRVLTSPIFVNQISVN